MMRNLVLAVVVAGLAAGTAVAADNDPSAMPPQASAPTQQSSPPAQQPPAAGWHGDHWVSDAGGSVAVHRGEGPPGEGWRSDGDDHWHRYGEWHGGGPGMWYGGPPMWRGPGVWGGYYPHGYNVEFIPGDYGYRRFKQGGTVPPLWRDDRFQVRNWFAFGLHEPAYGYRWIRYYNDALLIGVTNGVVYEVVPDVDWHRAYGAPYAYGPGYGYGPPWGWGGWHYGWIMPASVVVTTPVTKTTVTEEDYVTYRHASHHHVRRCSCK